VQEGLFRKIEHELDSERCVPVVRLDARPFRAPWNLVICRCDR
jgi:hypothetical protein